MDILFITDQNYLNPTAVSMMSVCENNKDESITFHVLTDAKKHVEGTERLVEIANKYGDQCIIYRWDFAEYESMLPMGQKDMPIHCSIAAYYRLFAAEILPTNVTTVLYLDSDIIVRTSISELFENKNTNVAIEGVIDNWEGDITKFNRLKYNPSFRYINTGVLIIHLDYWRSQNVLSSFISFIRESPERILHHDQDVINYCLHDKKSLLPYKYNVQDGFLMNYRNFLYFNNEEELSHDVLHPSIIHYCSSLKPWHKGCNHPYTDEFIKYMRLAGLTLKDFPQRKLTKREKIRSLCVKCGLIKEKNAFIDGIRLTVSD